MMLIYNMYVVWLVIWETHPQKILGLKIFSLLVIQHGHSSFCHNDNYAWLNSTKRYKSSTVITIVPFISQENFATLAHLISLDLSNNQLTELPENFGQLVLLQRLDLYSNKLKALPLSFARLKQLKWLDLKNNDLQPELATVAGTCVDGKECKECAQKVYLYCTKYYKIYKYSCCNYKCLLHLQVFML